MADADVIAVAARILEAASQPAQDKNIGRRRCRSSSSSSSSSSSRSPQHLLLCTLLLILVITLMKLRLKHIPSKAARARGCGSVGHLPSALHRRAFKFQGSAYKALGFRIQGVRCRLYWRCAASILGSITSVLALRRLSTHER